MPKKTAPVTGSRRGCRVQRIEDQPCEVRFDELTSQGHIFGLALLALASAASASQDQPAPASSTSCWRGASAPSSSASRDRQQHSRRRSRSPRAAPYKACASPRRPAQGRPAGGRRRRGGAASSAPPTPKKAAAANLRGLALWRGQTDAGQTDAGGDPSRLPAHRLGAGDRASTRGRPRRRASRSPRSEAAGAGKRSATCANHRVPCRPAAGSARSAGDALRHPQPPSRDRRRRGLKPSTWPALGRGAGAHADLRSRAELKAARVPDRRARRPEP